MTYFFEKTKTKNIVNSLFITDSYRICQKLRDLKAFQVTFNNVVSLWNGMIMKQKEGNKLTDSLHSMSSTISETILMGQINSNLRAMALTLSTFDRFSIRSPGLNYHVLSSSPCMSSPSIATSVFIEVLVRMQFAWSSNSLMLWSCLERQLPGNVMSVYHYQPNLECWVESYVR
jgi:hypothetical protein